MKAWIAMAATVSAAAMLLLAGCDRPSTGAKISAREAADLTGGDPSHAPALIRSYGCGACHTIAGVPGASATVGPPLSGLWRRAFIAGALPNSADNMVRWIQHPQQVDPKTDMPELGVTESDARDIAAYLYTLQ